MKTKKKRIVWFLILLGLVTGVTFAISQRNYIFESWYLKEVKSVEGRERLQVVESLGEVGADRSVDVLVELLNEEYFSLQGNKKQEYLNDGTPEGNPVQTLAYALGKVLSRVQDREKLEFGVQKYIEIVPDHYGLNTPYFFREAFKPFILKVKNNSQYFWAWISEEVKNSVSKSTDSNTKFSFPGMRVISEDHPMEGSPKVGLAAFALNQIYQKDPQGVRKLLMEASVLEALTFFMSSESQGGRVFYRAWSAYRLFGGPEGWPRELATQIAKEHPNEKVRALLLSFLVVTGKQKNKNIYEFDLQPLVDTYREDKSLLVKKAAIRLAGWLGNVPNNIDLPHLLQTETDPILLKEIVEARSIWVGMETSEGLELWDGFRCRWVPASQRRNAKLAFTQEELLAIEAALSKYPQPDLRDALSRARVHSFRFMQRNRNLRSTFKIHDSQLKVHEWGVWIDQQGQARPVGKMVEELPEFVHKSKTLASDLWHNRHFEPMEVTKPVLHFYSPNPVSLLVKVSFQLGRPWTYFPRRTDYYFSEGRMSFKVFQGAQRLGGGPLKLKKRNSSEEVTYGPDASDVLVAYSAQSEEEDFIEESQGALPAQLQKEICPPWLTPRPTGFDFDANQKNLIKGALVEDAYRIGPWLVPPSPIFASFSGRGSRSMEAMGLEWSGLRVGYPLDEKVALQKAPQDHWWHHLQKVPSPSISIRGEREKFLFYDGVTQMPTPIEFTWKDSNKETITFKVRSFNEYIPARHVYRSSEYWWLSDQQKALRSKATPIPNLFLIRVEDQKISGTKFSDLVPETKLNAIEVHKLQLKEEELRKELQQALLNGGLTEEETESLLKTWEKEFFQTKGTRALTFIPQWIYDAYIPIQIFPVPQELKRVGIILTEFGKDLPVGAIQSKNESRAFKKLSWKISEGEVLQDVEFLPLKIETDSVKLPISDKGEIRLEKTELGTPQMSKDGNRVAFCGKTKTDYSIYVADLKAKTLRRVFHFPNLEVKHSGRVRISGDGNTVLFSVQVVNNIYRYYYVDLVSQKYFMTDQILVGLSYDGRRILQQTPYQGGNNAGRRLKIVDVQLDGTLVKKDIYVQTNGSDIDYLELSGDGHSVVFRDKIETDHELYVIDLKNLTFQNITGAPGDCSDPVISSDGTKVLYEADHSRDRDTEIYFCDLGEKTNKNLTDRAGDDRFPYLSGNGKRAVYRMGDSFYIDDFNGKPRKKIEGTGSVWTLKLSWDGKRIAYIRWRGRGEDRISTIYIRDLEE